MLLCPGFGCTQQIWRYLVPRLTQRYQVIVFDHVGAGESDLTAYEPGKYSSLSGYAQDMVEICQALALRDTVVVGHSVGAMIALLAATQAPAHFAAAIWLAPSPCYINEPGYHGGFERTDILELLDLMEADYHNWGNYFAHLLMGSGNTAFLVEELAGYFCNTDAAIAKRFARVAFLADTRAALPRLQLPTLLLACSQDAVAPQEVGAYLLHQLPQATLVQLRTTGHCPHLSAPLETLAAMEAFLA